MRAESASRTDDPGWTLRSGSRARHGGRQSQERQNASDRITGDLRLRWTEIVNCAQITLVKACKTMRPVSLAHPFS